jgi:hypothetical protein
MEPMIYNYNIIDQEGVYSRLTVYPATGDDSTGRENFRQIRGRGRYY